MTTDRRTIRILTLATVEQQVLLAWLHGDTWHARRLNVEELAARCLVSESTIRALLKTSTRLEKIPGNRQFHTGARWVPSESWLRELLKPHVPAEAVL